MVIFILKILKKLFSKIIVASLLIYGFNVIGLKFNIFLPINLFSISFVGVFGSLGILFLMLFKFFL